MKFEAPSRRRGTVAGRVVSLLIACLIVAVAPAAAQEEEDLGSAIREMRSAFDRARERSDELDFSGAIQILGSVIEPRRAARPEDLDLEELDLLVAAFDLRARAFFNTGHADRAEADFSELLRLNPAYRMDRETLSPKVVALFDQVRARVAGILTLQLDPPDARVLVDGVPVERGGSGIALLAGDRELRLEMDGYDPHVEMIHVIAGSEMDKSVRLRPNRRALQFITVPADVSISIDGSPAGLTSGPATPYVVGMAERYGFDPGQASAPLEVTPVKPGVHKVTFKRACYEPQTLSIKVALDLEENAPLRFAPVIMKEARTDLKVRSTPSGSLVLVDGVEKGKTPVTVSSLCGGERGILVVKPGVGTWRERIRLKSGTINVLDVRLRPTLIYVGTFRLDDWGRATWSDQDRVLLDELDKGLKTLNLVRAPEVLGEIRKSIIDYMILDPRKVREGAILSPSILEEAADKAQADLVLAGLTLANDPENTWTLALYSVLHPVPDRVELPTDGAKKVRQFVRRLDTAPAESEAWWGVGLADSRVPIASSEASRDGGGGPVVVRVLPGSPAATAGLLVGDRVIRAGTRAARSATRVTEAMLESGSRSDERSIDLVVENESGRHAARLVAGASPVVIPFNDPTLLYNRALAEFRLRSRAADDDAARGAALLNLGITYMHFRDYDRALSKGFERATLPERSGISRGTLDYYEGLCSLRHGNPGKARSAFEAAAEASGSTLGSGDGPSVTAAARRMLRSLQ
jgi:tetratricopeptide (TPR) repeat protein